jgi:hypothetical protein
MGVLFREKLGDWILGLGFHCYFVLLLWDGCLVGWLVIILCFVF